MAAGPRSAAGTRSVFGVIDVEESAPPGLLKDWPGLGLELDDDVFEALAHLPYAMSAANQHLARVEGAERTILTHFFNDAQILVNQVNQGDGRSAARTARSLFEHLANYVTVTDNPGEAERYVSSQYVTADRLGRLTEWWVGMLDGEQRESEVSRLEQMVTQAAAPLAEASERFDTPRRKYVNNVFTDNLYRRCEKYGMAADYEAYRVLSAVVHGDAGGLLGLTKHSDDGPSIHRVGPDLQLVVLAWLYGFRWVADLLLTASHRHPYPSVREAADHAGYLVARFGSVLDAAQELDQRIWPTQPPPQPVSVAAFFHPKVDSIRWYLYDEQTRTVQVADAAPGQEAAVANLRQGVAEAVVNWHTPVRQPAPLTVECPHIRVYPRSARYADATKILPSPEYWLAPLPPFHES